MIARERNALRHLQAGGGARQLPGKMVGRNGIDPPTPGFSGPELSSPRIVESGLRFGPRSSKDTGLARNNVTATVCKLRTLFPYARLRVRADAGFADGKLLAFLDATAVEYVLGLAGNRRPDKRVG
jgi:hypothetical protein